MTLAKDTSVPFQRQQVLSAVQRCAPDAAYLRESPLTATIALHTVVTRGFDRMFLDLERRGAQLGISSIGLRVSTLKDIYLKLTLASVSLSEKTSWGLQLPANLATLVSTRGSKPGTCARSMALMLERVLFLRTRCRSTLLGALMPVLVLVAAFQWMAADQPKRENATSSVILVPVSLRELYPDARVFLDDDDEARKGISPYYVHMVKEEGVVMARYDGTAGDVLLQEARADYVSYTSSSVLGAVFRDEELQAWFNPYAIMSKSLAFDLVSSALLAFNTGSFWARFETTLAVHIPQVMKQQRKRRLKGDPDAEDYEDDPMGRVDEQVHSMAAIWALMGPLALALIASSFVAFPSAESSSGFMQLVLMTGVPGWLHCLCNTIFDLALYVWVVIPASAAFASYFQLYFISYKALLSVFATAGILCILSAYDIAYWSSNSCRAHVTAFIFFGVTVLVEVAVTCLGNHRI
nr:ATP-binding cassette sub-family A member 17-like [Dermacentor andersoni]